MTTRLEAAMRGIVPGSDSNAPAIRWRGLGRFEDLAIDFAEPSRPDLVTALLVTCRAGRHDAARRKDDAWKLTLAARIGGLLSIVAQTRQVDGVELTLVCAADACGEPYEVRLPVDTLLSMAQEAEREPRLRFETDDGDVVVLRRPTGYDQQQWRAASFESEEAAHAAILASLVSESGSAPLPPAHASAAMESFDPLPCFRVSAECPTCGREQNVPVDLEAVLVNELERSHHGLLWDVHRLARAYGWSEETVASIPPARRAVYLRLIRGEEGGV